MSEGHSRKKPGSGFYAFLERRWKKLQRDWKRAGHEQSTDSIHDLRVSARRFLSVIDVCRYVDDSLKTRRARQWLKAILDRSGIRRDLQVERLYIVGLRQKFPELKEFDTAIAVKELRQAGKLKRFFKSVRKTPSSVSKLNDRVQELVSRQPRPQLRASVIRAVSHHHGRVMQRVQAIDPKVLESIHRVRVALKQFRYAVEIAQPLLTTRMGARVLNQIRRSQAVMGRIHDLEVLSKDLAKWMGDKPGRQDISPILLHLNRQIQVAVEEFMTTVESIATFWTSARS